MVFGQPRVTLQPLCRASPGKGLTILPVYFEHFSNPVPDGGRILRLLQIWYGGGDLPLERRR